MQCSERNDDASQWDLKELVDEFLDMYNEERDIRIEWEYMEADSCVDFLATTVSRKAGEEEWMLNPTK
ncbi:hypothetical protein AQUCO_00100620v1 [Aquilegia coerulea]|uniref:Uncharacterized protein n=1 Tax=Aquilegia coerulea TaxID=218851 RepID=A0A2G5FBI7_AQUCA|nr:hypothetical protein AQUCO_00100620v1 [Aquilegia coerulea]